MVSGVKSLPWLLEINICTRYQFPSLSIKLARNGLQQLLSHSQTTRGGKSRWPGRREGRKDTQTHGQRDRQTDRQTKSE